MPSPGSACPFEAGCFLPPSGEAAERSEGDGGINDHSNLTAGEAKTGEGLVNR